MRLPVAPNVPETQGYKLTHRGVDYSARYDKTVYAPESGAVSTEYQPTAGGNVLVLKGATGTHKLAHLSKYLVKSGSVGEGQPVGIMGATGIVTGPHLHWSLYRSGVRVDPRKYVTSGVPSEEMITSNDADILRIINSEVKGWNPDEVHSGKFDQRELTAWTGKPIAQLIREGWKEGEPYRRAKQQLAKSNAEKDKLISELNVAISKIQDTSNLTKAELQNSLTEVARIKEDLVKEREVSDDLREEIEKLKKPVTPTQPDTRSWFERFLDRIKGKGVKK